MSEQRRALEAELNKLKLQENEIENELTQYFSALAGGRSLQSKGLTFEFADLNNNIQKVVSFSPCYEAMEKDAKKLAFQIDDCRSLSDRLSLMVRRLDIMQIRAQQALACTEDVINLKECKTKMLSAIEEGDLPSAANYIRNIHEIGLESAEATDDYSSILEAEKEVKRLVKLKFNESIESSDISSVMSLCPLLQTLGLETDARDSFLEFMEKSVFVSVSADASSVDDATDPATAYAQSLSNVFNCSYTILQQYLSMVIQGMENSLGDVYFIRKLHLRCEQESGLVLKRYMKFRKIKDIILSINSGAVTGTGTMNAAAGSGGKDVVQSAELHSILDELALLIQYCCMYSKYLKQICMGAETRIRKNSSAEKVVVFPESPTNFDKMIEELLNRYYMEGEKSLMKRGIQSAFETKSDAEISNLDECFFILQRCGHRAVATNSIHGACAILYKISDLLVSDLLKQATNLLNTSISKISVIIQEQITKYLRGHGATSSSDSTTSASITSVLKGASSLASSITGSSIQEGDLPSSDLVSDPYGLNSLIETFNTIEICMKYTDRLRKDVSNTGDSVFQFSSAGNRSEEGDKFKLCLEDFDSVKSGFNQLLHTGAEQLVSQLQQSLKDIIVFTLGRNGYLGGIKFELDDDQFDQQPSVGMLPKSLVTPIENMVDLSTSNMSENNKDIIVGLLANICCEKIEQFIYQSSFRFAGALKLEECFRSLSSMFTRYSTVPIRGKFSRLREIMQVLTSDVSAGIQAISVDIFSHLTANEVRAFLALRIDAPSDI